MASPAPLETGRPGQPKPEGGDQGPREASSTKLKSGFVANHDSLGFWTVDICREGPSQRLAPQRRRTAHLRRRAHCTPRNRAAGTAEVISRSNQAPGHLSYSEGGHTTQAQSSLHLCGVPENLNLSGFDLGSALNPRLTSDSSWQSNLKPEQCRLGKHTHREQGQTQCGRDTENTPHRCQ